MHPTPILATFSNISGRPKDIKKLQQNPRSIKSMLVLPFLLSISDNLL